MRQVYLIILSAIDGDYTTKVVDKETFDWLSKRPIFPSGITGIEDPDVPSVQIQELSKVDKYGDTAYPVTITIGSWENDRAMDARSLFGYDEYYCEPMMKVFADIAKNGDEVVDEYHGMIY